MFDLGCVTLRLKFHFEVPGRQYTVLIQYTLRRLRYSMPSQITTLDLVSSVSWQRRHPCKQTTKQLSCVAGSIFSIAYNICCYFCDDVHCQTKAFTISYAHIAAHNKLLCPSVHVTQVSKTFSLCSFFPIGSLQLLMQWKVTTSRGYHIVQVSNSMRQMTLDDDCR